MITEVSWGPWWLSIKLTEPIFLIPIKIPKPNNRLDHFHQFPNGLNSPKFTRITFSKLMTSSFCKKIKIPRYSALYILNYFGILGHILGFVLIHEVFTMRYGPWKTDADSSKLKNQPDYAITCASDNWNIYCPIGATAILYLGYVLVGGFTSLFLVLFFWFRKCLCDRESYSCFYLCLLLAGILQVLLPLYHFFYFILSIVDIFRRLFGAIDARIGEIFFTTAYCLFCTVISLFQAFCLAKVMDDVKTARVQG